METVELPGLQAEGEKLESTPLQTTPAELETRQLNLRHRTVEFMDAPQGRRAPSHINKPPIIPSEPPDITRSTESSHAKSINPKQAHVATEISLNLFLEMQPSLAPEKKNSWKIPLPSRMH